MVLAAALGAEGPSVEAGEAVAALLCRRPDLTADKARAEFYFGSLPAMPEHFIDRFVDDLRHAGLKA